jgi:hypothetical protein
MSKPSFAAVKSDLDAACASLRGFTLGHPGFTQRDGAAWIERVRELCDRLGALFASGQYATRAATLIASARARARAAQARLDLLRARRRAGSTK